MRKLDTRPREVLRQQLTLLNEAFTALEKVDRPGDAHHSAIQTLHDRAKALTAQVDSMTFWPGPLEDL